ncbi:MAG TPA: AraC family transcriptional regulator [Xanthobacteraceae bacterium]|jgi:AraC family transcriptional regulator
MLTYSLRTNAAQRASLIEPVLPDFKHSPPRPTATLLRIDDRLEQRGYRGNGAVPWLPDDIGDAADGPALQVTPANVVNRHSRAWDGIRVEILHSVTHDAAEYRFRAPCHLLLVYEEGVRDEGETHVGSLPCSTLRTLRRKLTFVPAGHDYREWHRPRIRSRIICFYLDPAKMPIHPDATPSAARLAPRVLYENNVLWETAVKLGAAIEDGLENERYCEALGVVIAHELMRSQGAVRRRSPPVRGGLAVWQQRIVATYIEEHVADAIPLAELAKLVNLSAYYFCRAFKQSFGVPPHRYHINRRIECARTLLSSTERSVTEIALVLGFSETSSFTAAFRQSTGIAPTEYRRSVA